MIFDTTRNVQINTEDGFDGLIQAQRVLWSKRILQMWLGLYIAFWGFLTIALSAENDLLGTGLLVLALSFVASFVITLLFIVPHMTISRFHQKQVTPDEILLAVAFGMGLLLIIPACLYLELGVSVLLAFVLALFQGLVLMSRYSGFKEKLTGGSEPRIFPTNTPALD
jgi:hypothetical protein